jgi:hypothetical protein
MGVTYPDTPVEDSGNNSQLRVALMVRQMWRPCVREMLSRSEVTWYTIGLILSNLSSERAGIAPCPCLTVQFYPKWGNVGTPYTVAEVRRTLQQGAGPGGGPGTGYVLRGGVVSSSRCDS